VNSRPITDIISVTRATADLAIVEREKPSDDLLLGLFRFQNTCKKILAALSPSRILRRLLMSDERPAHKLVECARAYLEYRLASRRSYLGAGLRVWRWDPEVVALNNALNFLNQAQSSTQPCTCVYCAGAPFYASKKPVTSVGLAQARKVGA
jgi:hypothetical protein